jgi:hypothetical protein
LQGFAKKNDGMIDKTARETQALKDAWRPFAEALTELGLREPFYHRTAAEIDALRIVLDIDPRRATKTGAAVASAERVSRSGDAKSVSLSKTAGSLPIDLCQ